MPAARVLFKTPPPIMKFVKKELALYTTALGMAMLHPASQQAQITQLFVSAYNNVVVLDFDTDPPTVGYTGVGGGYEGCAHAEDADGNMIFWVQAIGMYDANNTLMPGSVGILADPSSAEMVICPIPGDPSRFYVIYNDQTCSNLYYSIVDMTLAGGLGDVTDLNTLITAGSFSEGLEIVRVPCQDYMWLLAYDCAQGIIRYRIDADGIGEPTLLQAFPSPGGYDGRGELDYHAGHMGIAFAWSNMTAWADFDPVTGDFSNFNTLAVSPSASCYGLEFSPSGQYAYVSSWYDTGGSDNFFVIDLASNSVIDSYYLQPSAGSFTSLGEIELGPDGNLYMVIDGGGFGAPQQGIKVIQNANDPINLTISEIMTTSSLALGMDDPIQSDLSGIVIGGIPDDEPVIPNVFTPNNDGKNDKFVVGGIDLDLISDFKLVVFNRWGQEVHRGTSALQGWTGKVSGGDAPDGVYFFLMDLAYEAHGCGGELLARKELPTQKGWVQLLR